MKTHIIRLTHDAEHRRELFALIGELAASRKVHQALGVPVTSEPGRRWLVLVDEEEEVLGMASLHLLADGKRAKLQHLYAVDGPHCARTLGCLLRAAASEAKRLGRSELHTVDTVTAHKRYETHGWSGNGKRGQYVTYTKELS